MRKGIPYSAILSSLLATPLLAAPVARPQPMLGDANSPQTMAMPAAPAEEAAAAQELQRRLRQLTAGEPLDAYGMQQLQERMARAMQVHLNRQLMLARATMPVQFTGTAGVQAFAHTEKGAFLGVATSPATGALRAQLNLPRGMGLVVDYVEKGSPAEQAGIQVHDILQKLDDQWLVNPQQLAVLVRAKKPGDSIPLTVIRGGKEVQISAKLGEKDLPVLEELQEPGMFGNPGVVPLHPMPEMDQSVGGVAHAEAGQDFTITPHSMKLSVRVNGDGSTTRTLQDDENEIQMTTHGDQSDLVVKDRNGHESYSGPVDKADLSPEVKAKVEMLKARAKVQIGGAEPGRRVSIAMGRTDDQHQITLRIDNSGRTLEVKEIKTGKVLFNGPVKSDEDLKDLPADVQAKVKALSEKAHLEDRPDDLQPPTELKNF